MKIVFCKHILLCASVLLLSAISCSNDRIIHRKDDCGKHLFDLLKNFDPENKQEFEAGFISLEAIHRIGNDRKLMRTKKKGDRYANMTKEEYEEQIIDYAYNMIYEEGDAFDIDWRKIKYTGFGHKDQKFSNLESIKGKLVFEYNKRKYDVGCIYVKVDNEWKLAGIAGFFMQGVNNPPRPRNPYLLDI